MPIRDDVVLRMVQQLVEALLRAAGLRRKRDFPAAEQAIGDGLTSLGLPLDVITRLDVPTLAGMLGDKRVLAAVALLELARLRDGEGRTSDAASARDVARALLAGITVPDELAPFVRD